jgi:signal transduction histidine kinase
MENSRPQDIPFLSTNLIIERLRSKMMMAGRKHLALEKTLPLIVSHLDAVISSGEEPDGRKRVWLDLEHVSLEDIVTEYDILKDIIIEMLHPLNSEEKNKVIETILYYMGLSAWEFSKQANHHHQEVEKHLQEEIKTEKRERIWFENVLDTLPVGITIVERTTGKLLFANNFAHGIAGGVYPNDIPSDEDKDCYYTDREGKRISRNDLPRFRAARGEKLCGFEMTVHAPGIKITLVFHSDVIPASDGLPERIVMAFQEIDERKKWEEQKNSEVKDLKEERTVRETFVSSLTHDLRTPLSVARMHTEMIARCVDKNLQKKCRGVIKHIDEVDRMIQDLLDANKLKAGEALPIHPCEMCLNDIVEESIADFTSLHGDRFIVKSPQPVCGFWCGKAMRRMLDNLLGNAVKYGDPLSPIEVCVNQDSKETTLQVHNQGPVIPVSEQKKLFEPFKRAKETDKKSGWGIGLSLVKGLVEAHHGEVALQSREKEGTTFKLTFPNRVPNYH